MPTTELKKLADEYGVSIKEAEECWNKAKSQANQVYKNDDKDPDYWGFVVNKTKLCLEKKTKKPAIEDW